MSKFSIKNIKLWLKGLLIRLIRRQYPNKRLTSLKINKLKKNFYTLYSSTESSYLSPNLFLNWKAINDQNIFNIKIYSHTEVNEFMLKNYKDHPIYNIYLDATIPVLKIDIFRICFSYIFGGIWIDFKSSANFEKCLQIIKSEAFTNGFLIEEDRLLDVKNNNMSFKKNVIHNGFFYLPAKSVFAEKLINNIVNESQYYYDIVFNTPKNAILNLSGPNQFTKTFHSLPNMHLPILINQKEIDFIYLVPYSRFFSIFHIPLNYGQLKNKLILKSNFQKGL